MSRWNDLFDAVEKLDVYDFKRAVRTACHESKTMQRMIDVRDGRKRTLLHAAIRKMKIDHVRFIMSWNERVHAKKLRDLRVVERKESKYSHGEDGENHDASFRAILLKKETAFLSLLSARDKRGRTPLHFASSIAGFPLDVLLNSSCGIRLGSDLENRVLRSTDVEAVQRKRREMLDMRDVDGRTALHFAANSGHGGIRRLIYAGANTMIKDNFDDLPIDRAKHDTTRHAIVDAARNLHIAVRDRLDASTVRANSHQEEDSDGVEDIMEQSKATLRTMIIAVSSKTEMNDSRFGVTCQTALHHAAEEGEYDVAHALLERGADVNCRDAQYYTPLHCAMKTSSDVHVEERIRIAADLVQRGASIESRSCNGRTPLHVAIIHGNMTSRRARSDCRRVINWILSQGADKNARDASGNTSIHIASRLGNVVAVATLLDSGANPLSTNPKTGRNALHAATLGGHLRVVRLLCTFDAERQRLVSSRDHAGRTPDMLTTSARVRDAMTNLWTASSSGDYAHTNRLLHAWSKRSHRRHNSCSEEEEEDGEDRTVCFAFRLMKCIHVGPLDRTILHGRVAAHLAVIGACLSPLTSRTRRRRNLVGSIDKACVDRIRRSCDILTLLRDLCGDDALNEKDKHGITPLMLACARTAPIEIAKALVRLGVDVSTSDERGNTAMHYASAMGRVDIVDMLKRAHAESVKNRSNETPSDVMGIGRAILPRSMRTSTRRRVHESDVESKSGSADEDENEDEKNKKKGNGGEDYGDDFEDD